MRNKKSKKIIGFTGSGALSEAVRQRAITGTGTIVHDAAHSYSIKATLSDGTEIVCKNNSNVYGSSTINKPFLLNVNEAITFIKVKKIALPPSPRLLSTYSFRPRQKSRRTCPVYRLFVVFTYAILSYIV